MNNVKFLVCNINDAFPADINEMIFKKVQENAAESIQRMYYLRVKINLDALLIFNNLTKTPNEIYIINKIIAFYGTRIKYYFIQEPGIWVGIIKDLIYKCAHFNHFHINNANDIINRVMFSNLIFRRTGIEWWENL